MSAEPEDSKLLERIRNGDKSAFAVLVKRHGTRFYRVAFRFTSNRTEAEDITQEAFVKLWERPNLWQEDKNTAFTTWFYRVVVNMCLDFKKKKRPASLVDDTWIADERESHEEALLQNEKQQLLEEHIGALPERQRVALNLCFYEGLSNQEAADVMDINIKALQSLLMRAKATLKERIGELYAEREAI